MSNKKQFYSLAVILMFLFSFGLLAQTTIDIEAENYTYNEDPDSTWLVVDDATASGGQILSQVNSNAKKKQAVGWKIETTSATDTVYHVWYYARHVNSDFHRFYVNLDGDTTTAGSSWPFQYFQQFLFANEIANNDSSWHWYQNFSGGQHDSIIVQPGQHVYYLRQRDGSGLYIDKIKITNDLTWKPEIMYEWEAEDSNWAVSAPLEVVAEAGASGGSVVGTQAGSGTIQSTDIINGNLDAGLRPARAARDNYYLWMLVNLPTDASNSYWIGMGDEGIIPPSWEGAVTSGYEWRQLTDESGNVKPLFIIPEDFNKYNTIRIKQQEEGTKIDKYLLTNDPNYIPGGGSTGEVTTIEIEAENYTYVEDDTTWVVHDDVTASGGKYLAMESGTAKSRQAVGWKIDLTSSTDTIYYVWYYARRPLDSFAGYHRFYVNIDGDTTTAGSTWPFQYFNNTQFQEEASDSLYDWRWYQNHSGGGKHDSISIQPGQHVFYFRQRDHSGFEIDKIKLTNDLTWKPEVTYEWEAEDSNWAISAPMEVMSEAGASGGSVVATQAGSGTISNVDIINGNLDVGIRDGRVANDDCYLWMLVNLPSEASNSYWIGMGDEGIIPPSWEGAVTNGYEWRQLTDETGAVKPLHLITNSFNKFHTVRIKQQEEGTKIDKYLLTNNPDFVPTIVGVDDESISESIPKKFSISQNYPNPFNPTTIISYSIPKAAHVALSVYNILGQKVTELVNEVKKPGEYKVDFNASKLTSGVYFYTVKAGDFVSTKKMLLLK